jgi:cytochrome bd-I ubiquinol oxidase subunit X
MMWYFCWILGIGTAPGFGIINVMWLDSQQQKVTTAATRE